MIIIQWRRTGRPCAENPENRNPEKRRTEFMALEEAIVPTARPDTQPTRAALRKRSTEATALRTKGEDMRAALLTAPILPTLMKLALPTVTVLAAQTAV